VQQISSFVLRSCTKTFGATLSSSKSPGPDTRLRQFRWGRLKLAVDVAGIFALWSNGCRLHLDTHGAGVSALLRPALNHDMPARRRDQHGKVRHFSPPYKLRDYF
jgi:hypothetical protein